MVGRGALTVVSGTTIFASEVLQVVDKYLLGLGEAECIAIGLKLNSSVASDDFRARRAAVTELGRSRVVGSIGLLREAVHAGALTSAAATAAYEEMRKHGAFLPRLEATYFNLPVT
jgi:predicted nucleic acid-binding protein